MTQFRLSFLCIVVFAVGIVFSRTAREVEVPINVAIGPSFHYLPPALGDGQLLLPGIAFEAFAVITPDVMKQHKDRIPASWRRMISLDQEMHIKPYWLTLLPMSILIHPGKKHEAWASTWSLIGINWNANPTQTTQLQAGIKLPTLTWAWIRSAQLEEGDKTLLGLGVSPGVQALWRPSSILQVSAGWDQHFYLPIGAINEFTPIDRTSENWSWHGVFSLLIHVRIPSKQEI